MYPVTKRDRIDILSALKEPGIETESTDGSSYPFGYLPEVTQVIASVSELSGTSPTLDITIQGSDDGETWTNLIVLPQISAIGRTQVAIGSQAHRYYRYHSVIGGSDTPTFTYSLAFSC